MTWYLRNEKKNLLFVGIILFVLSFLVRFLALNQTDFANGWDGYYYVMQAHSFISYGYLQSLDYSLVYPFYIALSYLISDFELAFKVGTALLSALLTYSCFRIVYLLSQRNVAMATLGAAITIFSPGITFFVSQFPKNLLGIIFLLWVVYYLIEKRYLYALIFALVAGLTHRMAGGLGLIFLVASFASAMPWKYFIASCIILLMASFLPGILHFSDLARFSGQLSLNPQFSPLSFFRLGILNHSLLWNIELLIASVLCLLAIVVLPYRIIKQKAVSIENVLPIVIVLIVFFPFFLFESGSMGYRFFLLLFFIYPFALVFILRKLKPSILFAISLLLIVSSFFSYKSYNPNLHDAPNHMYHAMVNDIQDNYSAEQYSLIIAHKSLAEVVIFKSDFDALNWDVSEGYGKDSVLRIVEGIPIRFLFKHIADNQHNDVLILNSQYCVMPEILWLSTIANARELNDEYFMELVNVGQNPMVKRPSFLLKGKKK